MVKKTILVSLLLGLIIAPSLQAANKAEALYKEAVLKETGERDPEAALELYKQVIDQGGQDDKLTAKARLRMANCLERLDRPKEASVIYLQIIQESNASITEAVQAAQANLEKIQAQEKKAREEAERSKPMVLVKEFQDTGFSVTGGIAGLKTGGHLGGDIALAGRYRLSAPKRPLALYAELGGFYPVIGSDVGDSVQTWNTTTTDRASLELRYQIHLALVAELPHGKQQRTIPEMGIGAALTSSEITYQSTASTGDTSELNWSPYLRGGIRFFADKQVSLLIDASYTANPYSKNIQIASPAHQQSFDFPNALWNVGAQVFIKIGSTKTMMRTKE